jgi:hypothetical protein
MSFGRLGSTRSTTVRLRLHGRPDECEHILRLLRAAGDIRLTAVSPIYMDRYPSAYGRIYVEVGRASEYEEDYGDGELRERDRDGGEEA